MYDSYDRNINYLRISVTDRCNLRCTYCMPAEGVSKRSHDSMLSFEEIYEIVVEAAALGIEKIRFTGGEPLVRKNFPGLVRMVAGVRGIRHIGMTTNGLLLPRYADELKDAGLSSVNISLDTLNQAKFRELTRIGNIDDVMAGIASARTTGFSPIKINMVVFNETTDLELSDMQAFCDEQQLFLQLINHYELAEAKQEKYRFDRPPKCGACNRIRLTADGKLKPCLHSNVEIVVDNRNIREKLIQAIMEKPSIGTVCSNRSMTEIGG